MPRTASSVASATSSGIPSARAKSLAVPTGTTASGAGARAATSAAQPTDPSPPATTIRCGSDSRTAAASSSENRLTSAPRSRSSSSTRSASPDPDCGLASSATAPTSGGHLGAALAPLLRALVGSLARARERLLGQVSRLAGELRCGPLAGAERPVHALLRPPRGARQQEPEDRQDDADADDDRDGHESLLRSLPCTAQLPGGRGAETGAQFRP